MSRLLVGIDLGTSGARVVAYNLKGDIVGVGESEINQQNESAWINALMKATPPVLRRSKRAKHNDTICSVTSTSGSMVLVDKLGNMVFDPILYYEKADAESIKLRSKIQPVISDEQLVLSPTGVFPKLLKLKTVALQKFDRVKWVLSPTTWLLYRLFFPKFEKWEDLKTDWSNAMKFGATIDRTPKWHHQVFEIFDSVGLKPELLPQIVPPGTQIGHARSELADAMGLKSVMLYQGLTDGNASALAMGLNHPGDFGITCGSTSVVKFVAPRRKSHPSIYYHKHPLDGYLASAAFETGSVLKWFVSKLLGITLDEALNLADRIPAGTEWEYYPESNRSPFYDPSLGNSFLRIIQNAVSLNEVRGNFVRSLIVGLALHEYSYIPLFEDMFNVRIDKIRLLGGSAASDYGNETYQIWDGIRAAVWGRTILQMEPRTTAGVLIPAVLREGLYENIDEASKKLLRVRTIIEPDEEESDRYKPRRENFMKKWRLISKLQSFRHINFQDSIF